MVSAVKSFSEPGRRLSQRSSEEFNYTRYFFLHQYAMKKLSLSMCIKAIFVENMGN